ncbi:ankyrin repeat domain-containing protein [Ruegeria sp. Ofav3-42]|uniref:ankyrin repeat domain-containing protein n=1 Tax=Ruegeria sp. Ofav3-42 TaxID=2917759 RepID=UPI001EF59E7D|nr:ankyrin repeat domain-containing protein [Ruegeria sp. Ofav3-42]MCG7521739.1 ankyrin repeat domain-containing protein [Ruegeria sp. Ofav3-42]
MKPLVCSLALLAFLIFPSSQVSADEVADAARSGDIDRLISLLEDGAPVSGDGAIQPIHFACMAGQIDAVRVLLERGADPNASSLLGTPLIIAAGRKHAEIVELLLNNGADLELAGGKEKHAPMHAAAHAGATDIVLILIDHGADPDVRTKYGEPALHLAVKREHIETANVLRDASNWTPPYPPTETDLAVIGDDVAREAVEQCTLCHSLKQGEVHHGPPLWGVLGGPVARIEGFTYSKAMKSVDGDWDIARLDAFIADPRMAIPGNTMAKSGDDIRVEDRDTRWAIVAFLSRLQ